MKVFVGMLALFWLTGCYTGSDIARANDRLNADMDRRDKDCLAAAKMSVRMSAAALGRYESQVHERLLATAFGVKSSKDADRIVSDGCNFYTAYLIFAPRCIGRMEEAQARLKNFHCPKVSS